MMVILRCSTVILRQIPKCIVIHFGVACTKMYGASYRYGMHMYASIYAWSQMTTLWAFHFFLQYEIEVNFLIFYFFIGLETI